MKQAEILVAQHFSDLVNQINNLQIKKEDIVQVIPSNESVYLLYYK